jgi:dTMP kinase
MMRGLFITVEGTEGAGKSTALDFIEESLRRGGVDLVRTREPGGTELGDRLRDVILDPHLDAINPLAELLVIFAARAQHLVERIVPALERGQWVLCDRFTDATYAYQGAARGLGSAPVAALEDLVQGDLRPDMSLLLDLPVETGLERARQRGELDRFEQEAPAFFQRVRDCYLDRARRSSGRYRIVDAGQDIDGVNAELRKIIDDLLVIRERDTSLAGRRP